jgi:hypothetical protein
MPGTIRISRNERRGHAMRKFAIAFFVLVLMFGELSANAYVKVCYRNKDTAMEKAGDWFATLGKKGMEKNNILAKRRHDRFTACVQKNLDSGPRGKLG